MNEVEARRAIDDIAAAFYACFDNREGRTVDGAGLAGIMLPSATITKVTGAEVESLNLPAFLEPRIALLSSGELTDFHEWEVDAVTHVQGSLAVRLSTYEKRGVLRSETYRGGGRKLISLVWGLHGWKIAAVVWQDTIGD